jgi:predicted amidohydrolase YtcJ
MSTKYVNFRWGLTGERQEMEVIDGRVAARNPASQSREVAGDGVIDLGGRFVLPGFIDAHCHVLPIGLDLKKLHLGPANSHEEVLQMVRERHASHPDGWLLAVHYNQTKYEGNRHLTRWDLDKISSTRPIMLEHVNGHATVANSAALAASGIDESTPDPSGGVYRRDADGRLDGLCLEIAHEHVQQSAPIGSVEELAQAIVLAGEKMAALGITCASDMMTGFFDMDRELAAYTLAAQMGCPVQIRLYLQWRNVFGKRAVPQDRLQALIEGASAQPTLKVRGIKIFADGGISSATAAIYGRFLSTDPAASLPTVKGCETDGKLIYNADKLKLMVRTAHEAGWQVSVHTIGDCATDLVLDAIEATGEPTRHRIEHAMILSDGQIERIRSLGCCCTFQPEFLMALGPAYRKQLGEVRASKLIRSRSAIDAGIRLSFNSDRPIVAGDPWDGILTASNRPPEFDPSENCTRKEGILAYTAAGAEVNGDKDEMGTLKPGALAHFQAYDEDPLTAIRPVVSVF